MHRSGPIVLGAMLAVAAGARAEWSDAFRAPGITSTVLSVYRYGGDLLAGGPHDDLDESILRFDGDEWHPMGSGLQWFGDLFSDPGVYTMTTFQGELVVGGLFQYSGLRAVEGMARWDGSDWQPLPYGPGFVRGLVEFEGELVMAGGFASLGGVEYPAVVTWNGTDYTPLGDWDSGAWTEALAVYHDELYVIGILCTDPACAPEGIVSRWTGSGWEEIGTGFYSWATEAIVFDDRLIVAGYFDDINGVPAGNIAAWDGETWDTLVGGVSRGGEIAQVQALGSFGGELLVSGVFSQAGSTPATNVARWTGTEWLAVEGDMSGYGFALFTEPDAIHIGGFFSEIGGTGAWNVASFDGSAWSPWRGGNGVAGTVGAMTVWDGDLVAAGAFDPAGTSGARYVARYDGTGWLPVGSAPPRDVRDLEVFDGDLIAAYGQSAADSPHVLRFDGSDWVSLGDGAGFVGGAGLALETFDGELYLGGEFLAYDETSLRYLARWNGTTWSSVGEPSARVRDLVRWNGLLVAGGDFTSVGGLAAGQVATWNGDTWSTLGFGPGGHVVALTVHDGELVAAGEFGAHRVSRWNGLTWNAVPGTFDRELAAIRAIGDELFVGGRFAEVDGQPIAGVARWNGSSWESVGGSLTGGVGRAYDLESAHGGLYVGGSFTSVGGVEANDIARWDEAFVAVDTDPPAGPALILPNPIGASDPIRVGGTGERPALVSAYDVRGRRLGSARVSSDETTLARIVGSSPPLPGAGIVFIRVETQSGVRQPGAGTARDHGADRSRDCSASKCRNAKIDMYLGTGSRRTRPTSLAATPTDPGTPWRSPDVASLDRLDERCRIRRTIGEPHPGIAGGPERDHQRGAGAEHHLRPVDAERRGGGLLRRRGTGEKRLQRIDHPGRIRFPRPPGRDVVDGSAVRSLARRAVGVEAAGRPHRGAVGDRLHERRLVAAQRVRDAATRRDHR